MRSALVLLMVILCTSGVHAHSHLGPVPEAITGQEAERIMTNGVVLSIDFSQELLGGAMPAWQTPTELRWYSVVKYEGKIFVCHVIQWVVLRSADERYKPRVYCLSSF